MNGIKRGECNVSAKQTPTSFPDYSTKSWTEKEKNFQRDFPVNCKNLAEQEKSYDFKTLQIWKIISTKKQNPLKLRSNIYSYQADQKCTTHSRIFQSREPTSSLKVIVIKVSKSDQSRLETQTAFSRSRTQQSISEFCLCS